MEYFKAPKWAKPKPITTVTCHICGKVIDYLEEDYEAIRPKGTKAARYYHTECLKAEGVKL